MGTAPNCLPAHSAGTTSQLSRSIGEDAARNVAMVCTECGAIGPCASADDPPGHAEYLWNQRFGML
jgi:hypothetical protein